MVPSIDVEAGLQLVGFVGWIGAAIGAAAGLAGGILSNKGASDRNDEQIALSREEMEWKERMRATAYQTAMEDMRKAGLNPILAYQQGGASTPSFSMPVIENELAGAANAISTGLQATKVKEELANLKADTSRKEQEEKLLKAQQQKVAVDTVTAFEQNKVAAAEAQLKALEADRSKKYGESLLGRNLQSFERMIDRFLKLFQ